MRKYPALFLVFILLLFAAGCSGTSAANAALIEGSLADGQYYTAAADAEYLLDDPYLTEDHKAQIRELLWAPPQMPLSPPRSTASTIL